MAQTLEITCPACGRQTKRRPTKNGAALYYRCQGMDPEHDFRGFLRGEIVGAPQKEAGAEAPRVAPPLPASSRAARARALLE